ncbi:MAG: hypothetical protein IKO49_04835 [Bacilli bacterium]|nr:hypothetical protein [Bacilli bacterium]
METVFSYSESENAMEQIRKYNREIESIFQACDNVNNSLKSNLQADGVSEAAERTYNSLKAHYEEFNALIEENAQNINTHAGEMRQAETKATSFMEEAESSQNLQ